jgi:hypothetical protein
MARDKSWNRELSIPEWWLKPPIIDVPPKRAQAWNVITGICKDASLQENFGTHTLRKTWGYHARKMVWPLS